MTPESRDTRTEAIRAAMALGLHDDGPFEPSSAPGALDRAPLAEPVALIDRVRIALRLLGFDPSLTHLEQSPNGIVRGILVSGRFAHQSPLTRQVELRGQLERELGPDAMSRIGMFVTLTAAEAE